MATSGTRLGRIESGAVEHRLSPRKRVLHPVSIELQPGKSARLHDLSEGGLSVIGNPELAVGADTSLRFQLPAARSVIEATGVVAWSNNLGRAGLRFTRLQPDSRAALQQWLESDASASDTSKAKDSVLESKIASLAELSELQADICSRHLDRDAALDLIVHRMIELTRSSGAAIALRVGEEVVCRASAGNAPDVGVKLSLSSLSGECFRTGAMVLLSDSESDVRVDPAICRALNFRSLLVLPINAESEIVGIAEVLSPNPRNFEGGDILVLSFLADLIAGIAVPSAQNERSYSDVPAMLEALIDEQEASVQVSDGVIASSPVVEPRAETSRFSNAVAETMAMPVISASASPQPPNGGAKLTLGSATAPARELPEQRTSVIDMSSVSSIGQSGALRLPAAAKTRTPAIPRSDSRFPAYSEPREANWRLPLAAVIAVLLIATGLLFSFRRNSVTAGAPAITTASSPVARPISNPPVPSTSVPAVGSSAKKQPDKPAAQTSNHRASEPAKSQITTPRPAELRVIPGESAKPTSVAENAPEAPQIAQLSGSLNSLPASVVSARPANPQLQVVQSQGVTGGKLLKKVLPRYPDEARRAGISGDVVLSATIGTDGVLHNLRVVSGSPVLRDEALAAARQWRYLPATLSGKAVETDTRITMSFHHP